jgi:transcriptional regulator with XRE-family HTH domain
MAVTRIIGYCSAMEQTTWAKREAAGIGERVAHYRSAAKITAQQLAERCAALGLPEISRVVIAKLETGRREAVSTAELKVLAAALGVPPVLLLFPLGQAQAVEALPGRAVHPWDGIRWFTGEVQELDGQEGSESPISLFSLHHHLVSQWPQEQAAAAAAMKAARDARTPQARREAEELAVYRQELAGGGYLRTIRATMRTLGYLPPDLPPDLAAVFGEESSS